MKGIIRNTALHAFCLFVVSLILTGIRIHGGIMTYLLAGLILTLISTIIKPLRIMAIPLNMLSLGFFSVFVNMVILYLLTLLVPAVTIKPFLYQGYTIFGFIIPRMSLNSFFAFMLVAFVYTGIESFLTWLVKR